MNNKTIIKKQFKLILIFIISFFTFIFNNNISNAEEQFTDNYLNGWINGKQTADTAFTYVAYLATRGESDAYLTFNPYTAIGGTLKNVYIGNTEPYDRVAEYCIEHKNGSGKSDYIIAGIVDLFPDGTARVHFLDANGNATSKGANSEETPFFIERLKCLTYMSMQSILNEEGDVSGSKYWTSYKGAIQRYVGDSMDLARFGISSIYGYNEETTDYRIVSTVKNSYAAAKDNTYRGRFMVLKRNDGQAQLIYGGKQEAASGGLKVIKTDQNDGKKLLNVAFTLRATSGSQNGKYVYNNGGTAGYSDNVQHLWVDVNGEINLQGLAVGNYELKEVINNNYGYDVSTVGAKTFTIASGSTEEVRVSNVKQLR